MHRGNFEGKITRNMPTDEEPEFMSICHNTYLGTVYGKDAWTK